MYDCKINFCQIYQKKKKKKYEFEAVLGRSKNPTGRTPTQRTGFQLISKRLACRDLWTYLRMYVDCVVSINISFRYIFFWLCIVIATTWHFWIDFLFCLFAFLFQFPEQLMDLWFREYWYHLATYGNFWFRMIKKIFKIWIIIKSWFIENGSRRHGSGNLNFVVLVYFQFIYTLIKSDDNLINIKFSNWFILLRYCSL